MRPLTRCAVALAIFLLGALTGAGVLMLSHPALRRDPSALQRRLEATIYLPTTGNAGRPFTEKEWHAALHLLVVEFGGATLGAPVEGYWVGQGELQREPVRPVIISFEQDKLERFRRIVRQVGRQLGQEAIYTRFEEPRVELLPVGPESFGKDR